MTRTTEVEFETTINGGLPVVVAAKIHPAEPDVGILDGQPEFELFWIGGGACKINISDADWARIELECLDHARGGFWDREGW